MHAGRFFWESAVYMTDRYAPNTAFRNKGNTCFFKFQDDKLIIYPWLKSSTGVEYQLSSERTFELGDSSFYLEKAHMKIYAKLNTSNFAVEPLCPQTDDACVEEKNLFGVKG